jgi:hypothetical protein
MSIIERLGDSQTIPASGGGWVVATAANNQWSMIDHQ